MVSLVSTVSVPMLLGLTGMVWIQSGRAARERDSARSEQEKTERVIALLVDLFSTANPQQVPGGSELTVGEFLKRAEASVVETPGVDADVQARLRHTLGKVHMARSQYSQARVHMEAALDQFRRAKGSKDPAAAAVFHDLAKLAASAGKPAEAVPLLRQALELNRTVHGESHESVAQAMQDLGEVLNAPQEQLALL